MQEKPLIDDLTDTNAWVRWLDTLTNWVVEHVFLSLIHISEPTRRNQSSRMPSSA